MSDTNTDKILSKLTEVCTAIGRLDERVKNLEKKDEGKIRKQDKVWKIFTPTLSTIITIVVLAILYYSTLYFPQPSRSDHEIEAKIEKILNKLEKS